jgi:hypothetical protein
MVLFVRIGIKSWFWVMKHNDRKEQVLRGTTNGGLGPEMSPYLCSTGSILVVTCVLDKK